MKWSKTSDYSDTIDCTKHAPLVYLDRNTVIYQCSTDPDKLYANIKRRRDFYLNEQFAIFGANKFQTSYTNTLGVTGNKDFFVGQIKFSYDEFIQGLKNALNANDLSSYSEHFKQKMLAKVGELRTINTPEELERKFPVIYKDYVDGVKYYKETEVLKEFPSEDPQQRERDNSRYVNRTAYYERCGLRYVLKYFITKQTNMYEKMVRYSEELMHYIDKNYLNGSALEGLDKEKFELYVASEYLKKAKGYKNNHPNKELCINFVKEYFAHATNKNVKFTNLITHEEISYTSLYADFLPLVSSKVDWIILSDSNVLETEKNPKAKELKEEGQTRIREKKKEILPPDLSDPEVIKELTGAPEVGESSNMNFYDANKAKVLFYKDSGYIGVARGVELNKGYTAFIYPNGCVVMDLIASKEKIKDSIGNGIYVVNANEFIELSMLSKPVLRSLKEKRIFLYHKGDWEERLRKIIEKEGTEEEKESSLELVRVLNKKR